MFRTIAAVLSKREPPVTRATPLASKRTERGLDKGDDSPDALQVMADARGTAQALQSDPLEVLAGLSSEPEKLFLSVSKTVSGLSGSSIVVKRDLSESIFCSDSAARKQDDVDEG